MSQRVNITTASCRYQAVIEGGLVGRAGAHLRPLLEPGCRLFVLTVPAVERRWGKTLLASLSSAGFRSQTLALPDGERYKRLSTVEKLGEKLTRLGADRNAVLVAFGGGVVGDVVGFLASIYMRGIAVVQIPTTLQAQLDASIGGKTGVNLSAGKNLLGTFHQPRVVLIDPHLLSTLPERQFRSGLYEAVKCGVIGNPGLFRRLEGVEVTRWRKNAKAVLWAVAEAVKLKAAVVSADEREGDLRRVLNFGHTLGHALEAESKYRRFLHGEAVAWGMIGAARIAAITGRIEGKSAQRLADAVRALGPLPSVAASSKTILRLLQADKKTVHGRVHWVLPTAIGKVEIVRDVPDRVVVEAVDELRRVSKFSRGMVP
jgi:3-dehydroquinate synthase